MIARRPIHRKPTCLGKPSSPPIVGLASVWMIIAYVLVLCWTGSARALPAGFHDELVTGGLRAPTAMAVALDGRVFITEQGGTARVVKNGALQAAPFVRLTVDSNGERGLLGVAFHPNFASNGFVYFYHTVPGRPAHNRVTRFTADGDVARPDSGVPILDLDDLSSAWGHNGGAMHFGPDGKLYVAVGENGRGANAQSLANRLGKILRINADGSIPSNNPSTFPKIPGKTLGANRAIWAVGLRNPYTFAFRRADGDMLINDVGEGSFEEVNRGLVGRNYGWPTSEGPTSTAGFTGPIYSYRHLGGTPTGCAITGGAFYDPQTAAFPDLYVGKYFFADFCGNWIYYLNPAAPSPAMPFQSGLSKPVDLAVDPKGGLLYIQRGNGQLHRIQYTGRSAQAIVASTDRLELREGGLAHVAVRLAKQPAAAMAVSVARYLSDPSVTASPSSVRFTPENWSVPQRLTIVAAQDPDRVDDGASIRLSSPSIVTTDVRVDALDNDRPAGSPRAVISQPQNGDTVSGPTAEFFGDGVSDGTVVRAVFIVDGVTRYIDVNKLGHYHFGGAHNHWNTTGLRDGNHLLTMQVFDSRGRWGAHSITVKVRN